MAAVAIISAYALRACFLKIVSFFTAAESLGGSSELIIVLLKGAAVCIFTQIVHDICKDSGQTAVASAVLLAGRMAVVVLTLPLIETVLQTAISYIN